MAVALHVAAASGDAAFPELCCKGETASVAQAAVHPQCKAGGQPRRLDRLRSLYREPCADPGQAKTAVAPSAAREMFFVPALLRRSEFVTLRIEHGEQFPAQIRWTLGAEADGISLKPVAQDRGT